jgi:hypothetical protein
MQGITYLRQGAESFFRRQSSSASSLSCSQHPATCPYPQTDQSSPSFHPISFKTHFTIAIASTPGFFSCFHSFRILHKTAYAPRPTCLALLIIIDLITEIIYREEYRSWSISLCDFQQDPLTSSQSSWNIFLSAHFQTPSPYDVPTQYDRPCFTQIWNKRQTYNSGVCARVLFKPIILKKVAAGSLELPITTSSTVLKYQSCCTQRLHILITSREAQQHMNTLKKENSFEELRDRKNRKWNEDK